MAPLSGIPDVTLPAHLHPATWYHVSASFYFAEGTPRQSLPFGLGPGEDHQMGAAGEFLQDL